VVSLPLVLPPVATGLVLLMLLSRRGVIGRALGAVGIDVVFTWKAVVVAMAVMGLPLLVRTARAGFEQVDRRYEDVAATLGASPTRIFFTISLPLAAPSVIAGAVLAFARALGEFGATIMVAGSIPGATRTLAVAIYSYTEIGQDSNAAVLVAISAAIACVALLCANRLSERRVA
jgi:molybdate transport system permease protein